MPAAQIGAPVQTRSPGKKSGARKPRAAAASATQSKPRTRRQPTQIVVQQQPAQVAAPPKRRKSGGSRSGGSNDIMQRLDVKDKAIAIGATWAGMKFFAGKTFNGIPQSGFAAVALEWFGDGKKNPFIRAGATGLAVLAFFEYLLLMAIANGKLKELLAPYIQSVIARGGNEGQNATAVATALGVPAAAGDVTGFDEKLGGIANRHADGG